MPGDGAPPGELRFGVLFNGDPRRAARLERWDLDSLWVGGHIAAANPTAEALTALARMSAATERVLLGTSVLLLPLYPPAIVAKAVADLDRVTGGRVILGVGVGGESPQEYRACQVPRETRGRRLDEAIPLLRRLWTAEQVTHEGRYYPMRDVRIHPAPARPGGPPIVVAGRQDAAVRRAARLGDGWMPYLMSASAYARSVQTIEAEAKAADRDLAGFEWMLYCYCSIRRDGDRARNDVATFLGGAYGDKPGAMLDRIAPAGTPEEVAARLQEFVDAGVRHLIISPAAPDDTLEVVTLAAEEVLPRLTVPSAPAVTP